MGEMALALKQHLDKKGVRKQKNSKNEEKEQVDFIKWLDSEYPHTVRIVCPIVKYGNTIQRINHWASMKRMGYVKGTMDITFMLARSGYHGLVIEMKDIGKKMTPEQEAIKAILICEGYCVYTCYSSKQAQEVFMKYKLGIME